MVRVRSIVVVAVATAMTIVLSAVPAGAQRCGGVIRDGECAPTTPMDVPQDFPDVQVDKQPRLPPKPPPSLTVPQSVTNMMTRATAAVTLNVAVPNHTLRPPTYRSSVVAYGSPFAPSSSLRGNRCGPCR